MGGSGSNCLQRLSWNSQDSPIGPFYNNDYKIEGGRQIVNISCLFFILFFLQVTSMGLRSLFILSPNNKDVIHNLKLKSNDYFLNNQHELEHYLSTLRKTMFIARNPCLRSRTTKRGRKKTPENQQYICQTGIEIEIRGYGTGQDLLWHMHL